MIKSKNGYCRKKSDMDYKNAIIVIYTFFFSLISCNSGAEKKLTSDKYINYSVVSTEKYKSDSLLIVNTLRTELQNEEEFFDNSAYNGLTQIIIDSIIYSPDFTKLAAFVVVKNSTENLLYPDPNHPWYYDGTCYLGRGAGDSLKLYWVGPGFSQSDNEEKVANFLKDYYYHSYNTGDTARAFYCKYNIDDIRFWGCPIWDVLIRGDLQKKAFEEERIKHPENVYDPKRPRGH
jgi:hypothetical protein